MSETTASKTTNFLPEISASEANGNGHGERKERNRESLDVRLLSPANEEEWHQYGALRAKAYLGRHLIQEDEINEQGEEFDKDDFRSTHLGVFDDNEELVGCVRLIERFYDKHPLPVEEYFGIEADQPSLEASRLIIDRDKVPVGSMEHELACISLIRGMTYQSLEKGAKSVYATLERSLIRRLERTGFSVEELAGPIEVYNTKNFAIRMDPSAAIEDVATVDKGGRPGRTPELAGFFRKAERDRGIGRAAVADFFVDTKQFERNLGFISPEEQQVLLGSRVAIAGTGGDGGQLAIDLARMGVGNFTLADPENFGIENLNRQAGSNHTTLGRNKAEVVAEEILKINPYAKVDVFQEGVTEENIGDFVHGANLVIDETEYTMPEIGVMIARESRRINTPVSMALNVGHGARVINFHPEGQTLESWLGLDENASIEEIKQGEQPLIQNWVGRLPKYANIDKFQEVASGELTAPSLSTGVSIAAGTAGAQAMNILLAEASPSRAKDIVWGPDMGYIDSLDTLKKINPKSRVGFCISAIRAAIRTRRGKNPA